MKLIKINTDHYIVVDNSLDFSETDYYWDDKQKEIRTGSNNHVTGGYKIKITHSTQPLECDRMWTPVDGKQWMCNTMLCCGKILNLKTKPISLQEIKELIGEVDLVPVNEFGSEITVNGYGFDKFKYKIIIPKEEPKQELERGITITHVGKQETLEEHNYLQGFINQFEEGGEHQELSNYDWTVSRFLEWMKLNNFKIIKDGNN